MCDIINIAVTGGAGRIAYSLIPIICSGTVFPNKRVHLRLLDIPDMEEKLKGVKVTILYI